MQLIDAISMYNDVHHVNIANDVATSGVFFSKCDATHV